MVLFTTFMQTKFRPCKLNLDRTVYTVFRNIRYSSKSSNVLLSFQLKCSSNIDSIHYLGLTNSFHQVPRNIHTLPSIIVNFLLNSLNAPITFVVCATNQSEMIKFLELALSQEVYEYLEELDEMNWSAWGNVLNQYLRNTSIGTTVNTIFSKQNILCFEIRRPRPIWSVNVFVYA